MVTCGGLDYDDPDVCSGNGVCSYNNICECFDRFSGDDCEIEFTGSCFGIAYDDPMVCNGVGVCLAEDKCACRDGRHVGDDCSWEGWSCASGGEVVTSTFDFPGSSGCYHGRCVAQDTCACEEDWVGSACDIFDDGWTVCGGVSDIPNICSGHGDCHSGVCYCLDPAMYFGDLCQEVLSCYGVDAFSSGVCSVHGYCALATLDGECHCDTGFTGDECETPI